MGISIHYKGKYFSHFEVSDEGQYWETEDRELLKQKKDYLYEKINEVGEMLGNMEMKPGESPDSLVKRFEDYLKSRFRDKG